ncbi:TetR/AcrR family transcriptional regulator [Allokutzneria oryzae]|uniref:TetR/AcrR family transcriptional regulator n=1 Tax=Allokutzneria oryzae TaxID=1378989 RepID=A0ABV6A5S0_9PSEU
MTETVGRRERKKAATRKALADAALELFLERGYDQVSVKDVAEAADVSTTTLFKHFPSKEALVFDEDADREAALVAAVRERQPGQSIPQALLGWLKGIQLSGRAEDPRLAHFIRLVQETPALNEYGRRMWLRHEAVLSQAIAEEVGAPADDIACAALARFALDAPFLVHGRAEGGQALDRIFELLERGWDFP